ncbi:hypothetical protein ASC82_22010 [Streptomyces sp. Root431]|uniref:hypothetical protein n=1 Tax=Streptomyces sp. Root431 TaxID=1736535 RepID=UPI0006FF7252|nr:hypothetical protein [Streptomyces sp. Root431]KQX10366.1 hypothetical protein ASC82_22010 [Streptomyces sp. Root431]
MERAGGERRAPVTVENGAGVVVIGDNNRIGAPEPMAVRSGYREQVRRIAPTELVDRERELAELAAFCRADSGPAYVWWRAEAWAGKTALLSWFALNPPPGVRIVPFFVTARLGAQNDVVAYVDVVLEQLAELAGEGLPALLTAATREAHLLRLYASAAASCAARGERLVLLVDGLDEDRGVTTGPDAHSIASLLPYDLRVIVSGRLNPPLPVDVPDDHPLRDPGAVRILSPSPKARAIRAEAERELKRLLEAGGLPYELLALLTAAGGGLTADDLAELTGEVPYRVRDVLRTGPGRTFAVRGEAYLLAHEELFAGAREMLGKRELDRWRAVLHAWADTWRERGWPEETPDHLLHGYVPMLRAAGDVERLVACAGDGRRHERLLAVTGGDAAALAEIGAAEDAVLARADREGSVAAALRLALARALLLRDSGNVPLPLLVGWVAVGQPDRAVALARSMAGVRAVEGLCAVAWKLLDQGERQRAEALADEAARLGEGLPTGDTRDPAAAAVILVLVRLGAYERAEQRLRTITTYDGVRPRRALVDALLAAGRYERAVVLGREESFPNERIVVRSRIVEALVRAGRVDEAIREAWAPDKELAVRAVVLLRLSVALSEAGYGDDALGAQCGAALDRMSMGSSGAVKFRWGLLDALVAAGQVEAARVAGAGDGVRALAPVLARNGRWEEALELVGDKEGHTKDLVRGRAARELARAGDVERAMDMAPETGGPWFSDDPWPVIASALLARGDLDAVASLCGRLAETPDRTAEWTGERPERLRVLDAFLRRLVGEGAVDRARAVVRGIGENTDVLAVFAEVLYGAGHATEARGMLAGEQARVRVPARETLVGELVAFARALGEAGRCDDAVRLLRAVEAEPGLDPESAAFAALAAGRPEWAETFAGATRVYQQRVLFPLLVAAYTSAGQWDRALRLVEHPDALPSLVKKAAVTMADAGAWERARELASRLSEPAHVAAVSARMAMACVRQGRREDAERFLAVAREKEPDAPKVLDVLRAEFALEPNLAPPFRADVSARIEWQRGSALVLVVIGSYDEAVGLLREPQPTLRRWSPVKLVTELLRAAQYGHAATLLDGLHYLGPPCGDGYALLARAEPDPALARRWAVLALRLGEWRDVLPAVLAIAPEAIPFVLAEADRLRRALEV